MRVFAFVFLELRKQRHARKHMQDRLQHLLAHERLATMRDKEFLRFLRGGLLALLPGVDAGEALEDEAGEDSDVDPVVAPQYLPPIALHVAVDAVERERDVDGVKI